MDLGAIFVLGLTTGGLSCLAVQGGLLATAMARQVAIETPAPRSKRKAKQAAKPSVVTGVQMPTDPLPVVLFLAAKLLAYTILGALLGALGSVVQISGGVQAALQILAGLFMLATALNMLNVHPIFRYVVIQPPKTLTRLVRNQARGETAFTPLILGFLTVLIPCGTTQAMELLAISSGSALSGALILAVFVLGTSPTFLVLGFLATQFRGKLQATFATIAALLILALGFISIDAGLNIVGAPFAPSRVIAGVIDAAAPPQSTRAQAVGDAQEVTINVGDHGYVPNNLIAVSGKPLKLVMVTDESYSCARAFTIPSLGIRKVLPVTGRTEIDIPSQSPGPLYFSCSMGMYTGVIQVE
jgi:sulfite exporter TauE/SafE